MKKCGDEKSFFVRNYENAENVKMQVCSNGGPFGLVRYAERLYRRKWFAVACFTGTAQTRQFEVQRLARALVDIL
jgi:hypothetical protein